MRQPEDRSAPVEAITGIRERRAGSRDHPPGSPRRPKAIEAADWSERIGMLIYGACAVKTGFASACGG
jgi:hypothetical protein